jgi:thermitase
LRSLAAALLLCAAPAAALKVEQYSFGSGARTASGQSTAAFDLVVSEEAVVWFDSSVSTAQRPVLLQSVGASIIQDQNELGWTHVRLSPSLRVADALPILRAVSGVVRAEPNRAYSVVRTPNDALYGAQYQYGKILAPAGWEFETGQSSRTTIAVIDSGVESTHPDLQSKMAGLTHKACVDACVDDAGGAGSTACDHGSHVAGTAAAATDNGNQVSGVSWGSKILSMRVFTVGDCTTTCGDVTLNSCTTSDTRLANALNYLATIQNTAAYGRIVANLSVGCLPGVAGCAACTATIQPAIDAALNAGVVIVAAAGNSGPSDATVNRPAACSGVIPVTATDINDGIASFSSRGTEVATSGLAAPGVGILSTVLSGGTGTKSGTSMASPLVAGAAALILSQKPSAIVSAASNEVKTILRATADNVGLVPNQQGAGRLNLFKALRYTARGSLAGFAGESRPTSFPNPFRPSQGAEVSFAIPPSLQGASPKIRIYTLDGVLVRELTGMTWDGKNKDGNAVASGTYAFVVTTTAGTGKGRMAVIR